MVLESEKPPTVVLAVKPTPVTPAPTVTVKLTVVWPDTLTVCVPLGLKVMLEVLGVTVALGVTFTLLEVKVAVPTVLGLIVTLYVPVAVSNSAGGAVTLRGVRILQGVPQRLRWLVGNAAGARGKDELPTDQRQDWRHSTRSR